MLRKCPSCGKTNRIPAAHLAHTGRCGACKTTFAPQSEPLDVGPAEFQEIVNASKVPVLVDFWAAWCGPCRSAAPEVARVAHDYAGRAVVLKVDTEHHPELARRFHVQGIPSFAVLKDGAVVHQQAGLVDHRQLGRWIDDATR